jgi:CBS domain containing-hemolysin-like protein
MIHSVVDFRGVKVRDVMLPSAKVVTLQATASTEDALELGAASGLDRLPVVRPREQPAGLVNLLDILLDDNGNRPLGDYVRRIITTTEEEPAYRIVQQLRAARLGLAVVVDKKKNFRGIVTIDDLIRRLVSSEGAASA